ncbi:hypothetical protein [Microbacterium sp.]
MSEDAPQRRGFFDAVVEIAKYAMDREKTTMEGRINTLTLVLATLLLGTSPIWAATLGADWGDGKGSITSSVGDNVGGVAWIIGGGLVCVIIVAGSNFLRMWWGGRDPDDKNSSNPSG